MLEHRGDRELRLEYSRFAVDTEPYCYWMNNIHAMNERVVSSIDPEYWQSASYMIRKCGDKNEAIAAIHSRMYYIIGLEAMFALLFSMLQAPDCIIGWLHHYRKADIDSLIKKINDQKEVYTKIEIDTTWQEITNMIYSDINDDDAQLPRSLKLYEKYFRMFAKEMQAVKVSDQLNAIKHGFRIQGGGFGLAIGLQDGPGETAPAEKMVSLGTSTTGMTYWKQEKIENKKRQYSISEKSENWTLKSQVVRLEVLTVFMTNIKHMIQKINGYSTKNNPKMYLMNHEDVQSALMKPMDAPHVFDVKSEIHPDWIKEFTTEEILSVYNDKKYRRICMEEV